MIDIPLAGIAKWNDIEEIKKKYAFVPMDYIEFIKKHDGLIPSTNFVDGTSGMASVRRFIDASEVTEVSEKVAGFNKEIIPIAEDGSGNIIGINKLGNVVFWDHEIDEAPIKVADSFSDLLFRLRPIEEIEIDLETKPTKVWIKPGSGLFKRNS